jgi:glycosyltransferase involved in cell wall biosynthesis
MAISISVVIAARNAESTIAQQLDALCHQEYDGIWDVVVVDNLSTDTTAEIANSYRDRLSINVMSARDDSSVMYARNMGIAASTGDLIIFVDGDDVAAPGLLSAFSRKAGEFGILGGHVEESELNDPVICSWRYPVTERGLPTVFGRFRWFVGANCAVRRDIFDLIGVFDEELRYSGEDVEFSIRAQLVGMEIGWVPDAIVHYRHRVSMRAMARQQYSYGRGVVRLYKKYHHDVTVDNRAVQSIRALARLLYLLPNIARGRTRRGQWVRLAGGVSGQIVESLAQRIWYVG